MIEFLIISLFIYFMAALYCSLGWDKIKSSDDTFGEFLAKEYRFISFIPVFNLVSCIVVYKIKKII